jgi:hypothetical protein
MEKKVIIELESLKDLEKIRAEAGKWEIELVLIGGYAVRAYTTGYRYTKDMDFIAKGDVWKLKSFLNSLGFEAEEKKNILAGRKKINGGYIDLHISMREVFDISSGKSYPLTDEIFKSVKNLDISGYHEESRKITVKAPVIALEDLIIMKLTTKNREKDWVDIVSLLFDQWENLDLKGLSKRCASAGLSRHISESVLDLAGKIRKGTFRKIWLDFTGRKMTMKEEQQVAKNLIEIAKMIKSPYV